MDSFAPRFVSTCHHQTFKTSRNLLSKYFGIFSWVRMDLVFEWDLGIPPDFLCVFKGLANLSWYEDWDIFFDFELLMFIDVFLYNRIRNLRLRAHSSFLSSGLSQNRRFHNWTSRCSIWVREGGLNFSDRISFGWLSTLILSGGVAFDFTFFCFAFYLPIFL